MWIGKKKANTLEKKIAKRFEEILPLIFFLDFLYRWNGKWNITLKLKVYKENYKRNTGKYKVGFIKFSWKL